MMKFKMILSLLCLLGLLTFFSCEKDDLPVDEETEQTPDPTEEGENAGENTGRDLLDGESVLNIRLTDAPTDLQAVNIDVIGMQIIADNNRFELTTVQGIYNLLDFQDGIDTLISVDTFNISFLKDIVLQLGENNSVIDSLGVEHPLELPNGNRDFLTIKLNQKLDSLQLLDVQLDFDACKSVHETGNGRWILKPVIKIKKINDKPMDDDDTDDDDDDEEFDFEADKIEMIKAAYPDFDEFDFDRKEYCFLPEAAIMVEMEDSNGNEEQTVIFNSECELLLKVTNQDLSEIDDNIIEEAGGALNGNTDLFKKVTIYSTATGEITYGFRAIKGQGNAGKEHRIYIDEAGTLICTE